MTRVDAILENLQALGVDETMLSTDATLDPTFLSDAVTQDEEGGPITLELKALPPLDVGEPSDTPITSEYEVVSRLGEGGMGVVELARQRVLARQVALKRVKPGAANARNVKALLQEAMFTGYLEHPNIVPVHTLGVDGQGLPVLVMKRIEGTPWRDLIRDAEHPFWEEVVGDRLVWHLEIFSAVCNAVHFAHSRGILHRDIKPENVMVGSFGEVYLLDWGVGFRLDGDREGAVAIAGTPAYMAPEMWESSAKQLSERSDVFLLGATLHEVLTGQVRNSGEGLHAVMFAALTAEPFAYSSEVPRELAEICNTACARDPRDRFPGVQALKRAIETFLAHRASLELVDEAEARLTELQGLLGEAEPSALVVHRCFTEARFGFRQALRSWPENTRAASGLEAALEAMAVHELENQNPHAAGLFLAELSTPPPELMQRLESLEATLKREEEEAIRMRALAKEFDPRVGRKSRTLMLGLIAATAFTGATLLFITHTLGLMTLGHLNTTLPPLGVLSIFLGVLWTRRKVFLANRFNRMVAFSIAILLLSVILNRTLGAVLGENIHYTIMHDGVLLFLLAAIAANLIHYYFLAPALIIAAGVLISAAYKEHLPLIALPFIVAALVSTMVGWAWLRKREKQSTEETL